MTLCQWRQRVQIHDLVIANPALLDESRREARRRELAPANILAGETPLVYGASNLPPDAAEACKRAVDGTGPKIPSMPPMEHPGSAWEGQPPYANYAD